jgi:hypothetical protein
MEKAVTSIAIDPIYARANSGRRFMTASEDKLILHEKTFLSRSFSLFFPVLMIRIEGLKFGQKNRSCWSNSVLRIRHILTRIRIRRSVPLTDGSGYYFLKLHLHHFLKIKSHEVTKQKELRFILLFLLDFRRIPEPELEPDPYLILLGPDLD